MATHHREPHVTPGDVPFLASPAPTLADRLRRATLMDDAAGSVGQPETGFLVLAADDSIEMANPAAEQWIDELAPEGHATQPLPLAIRSVAAHTRRVPAGDAGAALASARVHTRRGRWVIVRGSLVGPDRVAVLLEAARPSELASATADACGFTDRERSVTDLVASGLSTNAIADRLFLSAYTIQDHLKAIFDKTGTSSRGELVARLFFDHRAPGPELTDLDNMPAPTEMTSGSPCPRSHTLVLAQ
jgi:DNA-binding NarL/FixJ family response regulator